jgi:hypothetical protein
MTLSSQKPEMRIFGDDYRSRRARQYGLRAVARALGIRDFVEFRRLPRKLHRKAPGSKVSASPLSRAG